MNGVILQTLRSHWSRNPIQLFTLLAGLALATALWSGVQAINAEARASYDAAAATLGEAQFDQITARDGGTIAQDTYIALRRAGWLVSPVVEGRISNVRLIGLDPLTAPGGIGPVGLDDGTAITAFLSGRGQVYGTQAALTALDGIESDLIVSPDIAPNTAVTDIGIAQRILGLQGQITRLIVASNQPRGIPALGEVTSDLIVQTAQSGSDIGKLTDSFHLNLTAFGLLSFAVGIFIVNGAIGLAFAQRRPVIRTLRALGVPLGRLLVLIAIELLILAIIAGLIGVILGYLIASFLLPGVSVTLQSLYGAPVAGSLQIRPSWWVSGLAISVGGTGLAAMGAFISLARMPLLSAGRPRAMAMAAGQGALWRGGAAAILLISAIILGFTANTLIAGFALLACLLIGASLALPLLIDRVLALASRIASGVKAQWFWADTRQQLPGLSLALMALLLAMAANVGVSTMVSSFRLTFTGFLDQRLASELYIDLSDETDTQTLIDYVTPRTRAILPIQSVDVAIGDQPTDLFSVRNDPTYRDNWQFLAATDQPWEQIFDGSGIAINEQLARRSGLSLGDEIMLKSREFTIVGFYGDYGNPIGQAIIDEGVFMSLYPQVVPVRFGLRLAPEDVEALVEDLQTDLGLAPAQTIDQSQIKALSLSIFDRTFTVTTALNILTLLVAAFAILMSLLTLATMRVPQMAPAWAMGMTRSTLGRLELLRAVFLATLTACIALPLGLLLAWALLAIVNVAAFGWELPMYLFPADYLRLTGLALLAAIIAALWPARRLAMTPPADLLKVFSNER